jgi:hypothetical protein
MEPSASKNLGHLFADAEVAADSHPLAQRSSSLRGGSSFPLKFYIDIFEMMSCLAGLDSLTVEERDVWEIADAEDQPVADAGFRAGCRAWLRKPHA